MFNRRTLLSVVGLGSVGIALAACGINSSHSSEQPPFSGLTVFGETALGIDPPGWEAGVGGVYGMGGVVFKSVDGRSYLVRQLTYTLLSAGKSPVTLSLRDFRLTKAGQLVSSNLAMVSENKLVFDLTEPVIVPSDGKTVGFELIGEIVGEVGGMFQFGIAAASDIVATDMNGLPIVVQARAGMSYPVKLMYLTVVSGGFKVSRAATSPSGAVKLVPGTPGQTILVADIQAVGEDIFLNDMVVLFRLQNLRAADFANLRIRDGAGTLLGYTVVVPDAESLRLRVKDLRYLIRRNENRQLIVSLDVNSGAAGTIDGPYLGEIRGEGATSKHYIGAYSVPGATLNVG